MRSGVEAGGNLTLARRALAFARTSGWAGGQMLLLPGSLLAQLTDDLLPKPRGFSEHLIQPVEHLFQIFCADFLPENSIINFCCESGIRCSLLLRNRNNRFFCGLFCPQFLQREKEYIRILHG